MSDLPKTSAPAESALNNIGIYTLEALTKYTEKEILDLHGMGPKAIRILKEVMKDKGLSFKTEK